MKKYLLGLLLLLPLNVYAGEAQNISKNAIYQINSSETSKLSDNNVKTNVVLKNGNTLSIKSGEGISHIYIVYELESKTGILKTNNNEEKSLGKDGFLHEYIKLDKDANEVTIEYNNDAKISEITIFGNGDIPSYVQRWTKEDKTDLMIFSTHADDEQLFFSGVMPTYINKGKKVHVVYLARHDIGSYYAPERLHEQLDGLWTLGVTDYPTFGLIPDAYSESLEQAEAQLKAAGFTDDDIIKFDVEQLRKYQPKVILGHDENGEYGHGQHRLNTFTLKQAVEKSKDSSYDIVSLDPYEIPKFYIHLYDSENQTVLDYDVALEKYDGKTAYEVSKEGFAKHNSQQYTWFKGWLNGKGTPYTSAKQITKYNPMYWGLYSTTVGPDVNKNDLFENITEEKVGTEEIDNKETEVVLSNKDNNNNKKTNNKEDMKLFKINCVLISLIIICLFSIILVKLEKKKIKRKKDFEN